MKILGKNFVTSTVSTFTSICLTEVASTLFLPGPGWIYGLFIGV